MDTWSVADEMRVLLDLTLSAELELASRGAIEGFAVTTLPCREVVVCCGMVVLPVRGRHYESRLRTTRIADRQGRRCCLEKGPNGGLNSVRRRFDSIAVEFYNLKSHRSPRFK